jgi:hypothetical protein
MSAPTTTTAAQQLQEKHLQHQHSNKFNCSTCSSINSKGSSYIIGSFNNATAAMEALAAATIIAGQMYRSTASSLQINCSKTSISCNWKRTDWRNFGNGENYGFKYIKGTVAPV